MSCAESNTSNRPRPLLALASVLTAAVLLTVGVVLFCFDPNRHAFYPRCLFHSATGLLCPGCGSLRALHQLLHGHLLRALRCNALLVLSLPGLGIWGLGGLRREAQEQAFSFQVPAFWLWSALVVLVLFGILRNLPLGLCAWLRP